MKHLIFVTILFIIAPCISCNNSNANAGNKEKIAAGNSTSSSSSGDAVFSYNLDGTKISGGEVDALSMNNTAFVTQSDKGKKVSFFLNDAYKDNTETYSHSLRFAIPGKTGTTALTADEDNFSVQLFLGTGDEGKYVMYANESFNITVTSLSSTSVSGTFSGKLKLLENTGKGKNEFTITEGNFNIPLRNK